MIHFFLFLSGESDCLGEEIKEENFLQFIVGQLDFFSVSIILTLFCFVGVLVLRKPFQNILDLKFHYRHERRIRGCIVCATRSFFFFFSLSYSIEK